MGPTDPRRVRAWAAVTAASALALTLAGASPLKKKHAEPPPPKVEETVSNLADIFSRSMVKLEGVGLVVGLDNTGADPPPSSYRQRLIDDMRKEGVENPNNLLKSPQVAMVLVYVNIHAGATPADRIDARVVVAPASGTKSLAGGYLLKCRLREVMIAGGTIKEGLDAAFAQGPVMTDDPKDLTGGRILGGARIRKEVPHQLVLKDSRKSIRASAMVEGVVNHRFPQTEGVNQKGSAVAKTDQYLTLKVPHVYHQNQDRFFRVVKLLPMVDSPALRVERMERWGKELLDPSKAGIAALRLEGLGVSATEALKNGLNSPNAQVRFFAAEALAYLNDPAGADELAQTALSTPDFRAYALAALSAMDQPASHMKLRKLLDEPDVQVRYGAFNALRVLSPGDPFLGQVRVLDAPDDSESEGGEDSMSVMIARRSNKNRREDPFALYLVDCEGPPMVHVARTRRCEVVVFGRGQKLLTPVVLGNGPYLFNAADGDDAIQVSKIMPSKLGDRDEKVSATLELGDVLRRAANLGANYPELVAVLQSAAKQRNLPGPLVVDALPGPSPVYVEAAIVGRDTTAKKDAALKRTSHEDSAKASRRSLWDRLFSSGHDSR